MHHQHHHHHHQQSWTLTALVGAFLDLSLAYLLLCGSALVFFSSKLLSLFGLHLPCPCHVTITTTTNDPISLHTLLVSSPLQKISAVQSSLTSKPPFDSFRVFDDDRVPQRRLSLKLVQDSDRSDSGDGEEASCSSVSRRRRRQFEIDALDGGNSCEGIQSNGIYLEELVGEGINEESSEEELRDDVRPVIGGNEEDAIRALEKALEEEHAAQAALYVELEKERSAAATAADEAMAMILRLQKEKAEIEMEARQYQRMIEEKFAYDAEEMEILKEILMRREREKLFLEKEVKVYRQMMLLENEQVNCDLHGINGIMREMLHSSLDPSEDPLFMLQQISDSIDKREMAKVMKEKSGSVDRSKQDSRTKGMLSTSASDRQESGLHSEACSEFSNDHHGHDLLEKTVIFVDEEAGRNCNARLSEGTPLKNDTSRDDVQIHFPFDGTAVEKHRKDADQRLKDWQNSFSEAEPTVLDVHVIDDKIKLSNQGSEEESETFMVSDTQRKCGLESEPSNFRSGDIGSDRPSTSRGEAKLGTPRSSSDMSGIIDKSQGKSLLFELRSNSMSAVENERLKLENEVGWLRERLRTVQEGREKLSFSMEHREREKVQLQILEDIARQLNEIRQLTEPGKATRQISLPPSSSKYVDDVNIHLMAEVPSCLFSFLCFDVFRAYDVGPSFLL
ncbi:hypothetical protein Scep_010498 [Stephania cephalantha]|uniref:GTD-binding domain-containing protein n=1 Tax=Stephania cephalantha TaxID=152367 RepID=A0AAP0JV88_9MAGN